MHRSSAVVLASLLTFGALALPPAGGAALTCPPSMPPASAGINPVPGMLVVQGVLTLSDVPTGCGGPAGGLSSTAPPCGPPLTVHTVPGAYCGPVLPQCPITLCQAGGAPSAICAWTFGWNTVPGGDVKVYIALDYGTFTPFPSPMDGDVTWVLLPEGGTFAVYGPLNPYPAMWTITNPYPHPARIIGYPATPGNVAILPQPSVTVVSPVQENFIGCTI